MGRIAKTKKPASGGAENPPILLKPISKGIRQKVCESRTISFQRNKLQIQTQSCNLSLETTSTMLPTHPAVASRLPFWETEGLSLHEFELDNTTMEMDLMDELGAGIKEFNTGSSLINTPDVSHNTFDVFETPDLGLCAPANVVEGAAEEPQPPEAASPSLCLTNDSLELENLDLLQWIVNDQDINIEIEEPKPEAPHQEVERVSVIVPVVSQQFRIEPLEIKTENLSGDEKYRKMRDQNNEGKRCRANRKRKHREMDEELERLQERNVALRAQMDEMEREVRELKSKLLSDITISKKFKNC